MNLLTLLNIARTPGGGLIGDLAYNNDSFHSKVLLMLLGGIGTFIRNLYKGDIVEAHFAPASHLYSVVATARAKIKENDRMFTSMTWFLLGVCAALQAFGFGITAYIGVKRRGWARDDKDYDVLAAHLLALRMFTRAHDLILEGFEHYPHSILLRRRAAYYYMAKEDKAAVQSIMGVLEGCFKEEQVPHEKLRIARTLIEGWKFLKNPEEVARWFKKAKEISGVEKILDQLIKLAAL